MILVVPNSEKIGVPAGLQHLLPPARLVSVSTFVTRIFHGFYRQIFKTFLTLAPSSCASSHVRTQELDGQSSRPKQESHLLIQWVQKALPIDNANAHQALRKPLFVAHQLENQFDQLNTT